MGARGYKSKYVLTKNNEVILDEFIRDFKIGRNVSISRGGRKEKTLKKNYYRMKTLCYFADKYFNVKNITQITEEQVLTLFEQMEKGKIKCLSGKIFTSVDSYQATFKCFWRWLIKSRKKNGEAVLNITTDFIVEKKRPEFIHFTKDDVTEMVKISKHNYAVLMWFLFDSGVRPQEVEKLLVEDISIDKDDIVWLNVQSHVAKKGSFGRKIKLLLCNHLIIDWIKGREQNEPLFNIKNKVVNQYLGRVSTKVLGKKITMYDFRHNSCCYWINIYKKDQALKYRFGWKNGDMIEYYSRYIGLNDDVKEDDLISDEIKTRLEKEVSKLKMNQALKDEQHHAEMIEMKSMIQEMKGYLKKELKQSLSQLS